jgi:hypothetical protein
MYSSSEPAARSFLVRVARLEMMGAPALDALERMLVDPDAYTRNAAARALAGMHNPEAAARLIAAFLRHDRPQLDARSLTRLGKTAALPPSMLPRLDQVRHFERSALIRAWLRRRTPEAEAMVETVFASWEHAVVLGEAAVESMAGWGDLRPLRDALARPLPAAPPAVPFKPADLQIAAAHQLALAGDADGLDRLRAWVRDRSTIRAGEAVLRLALLAHPDGVGPAARLLRGRGGQTLELALDAAERYRTPVLAPALLAAAAKPGRAQDVIAALGWIVDAEFASRRAEPTAPQLAALASALDPGLRYASGAPLTLAILAEELVSRDDGPRSGAAYNLRAITGEDHGFDLADDLAGNLAAIEAWRARAQDEAPIGRGGWAVLGAPLAPPAPP